MVARSERIDPGNDRQQRKVMDIVGWSIGLTSLALRFLD
jgi:hypothetical protein